MNNSSIGQQLRYLEEVRSSLHRVGFETKPPEDCQLPILWNDAPLCRITGKGSVYYRREDTDTPQAEDALYRVEDIAAKTLEYMTAMEAAPQLKASGLDGDYRILADFGGTVLAGTPSKHGVQFVTWDWDYDRTGVSHGHYFMENYDAAKQDFATRSGLIQTEQLFSPEQLTEIYRCCADSVDGEFFELTDKQEEVIHSVQQQIEVCVPDLKERIRQQEEALERVSQEQAMYYVQNNHPAIIDRVTFNKVQEELARRKTKTPGSAKSSITSTGKYSRYALTDVLICGNCGTRYRRVTWSRNGVKRIVWRCISRLDYGKKYCSDSPTIMEDKLQEAIVRAVNKFNEQDNATYKALMRATISEALGLNGDPEEVDMLERKVEALNNKMLALVNESVSSGDGIEAHESEFMTLSQETELLKQRIAAIQESTAKDNGEQSRLEQIQAIISERESKSLMASRRKKPRCSSSNTVPTQRHRIMRLNFSKDGKRNRKFKRGIAPMLSKEGFCKALQMIKEQESIDEQFSKALNLVGDGHFVFGAENKYLMALRDVLKEAVNDQYDYIDWWLYEATDDYTVWEADCTMKYCLKDPEALYDYITGTLKPVPVSSGESTSQQE